MIRTDRIGELEHMLRRAEEGLQFYAEATMSAEHHKAYEKDAGARARGLLHEWWIEHHDKN
jgi:hypothetical protein